MADLRVFRTYGGDNAPCDVLQQVGGYVHLLCDYIADPAVVEGVFKFVAFGCPGDIEFRFEINHVIRALLAFEFETAVAGVEFQSFKFYSPFHLSIRKTQGLLPMVKCSFFQRPTLRVRMNWVGRVMSAARQSMVLSFSPASRSVNKESLR